MKPLVVYLLHSGQMFGTERMALATLQALAPAFRGVVVAPSGPVHVAAREAGLQAHVADGALQQALVLARLLARERDAAIMATSVAQSAVAATLQRLLGGRGAHLHVVHGGATERLSYGRKRLLQHWPVRFVAVSSFVRERLLAHGVDASRVEVVHNFLEGRSLPARGPFLLDGVRRVVMLSRLDGIKRVGLLFDALDRFPALREMRFDVYGSGEQADELARRAAAHPNVTLHGFIDDAARRLRHADLLLHTCPEEPFGLALLEAFAAGVPVLAPRSGGAAEIVEDGVTGFLFPPNDAVHLGRHLLALARMPASRLNGVASRARHSLHEDFSAQRLAGRYAAILSPGERAGASAPVAAGAVR